MAKNTSEEPNTAPQPDRWYDLVLGPSFNQDSSNKYCTLRYEFKPASIDKSRSGVLHKNKDNRVSVEFQNNQVGKPKVTFEGSSEDYKENDAVLFFDGETFRLERLHKAVNRLKHLRLPGESAVAAQSALAVEPRLSPIAKGAKPMNVDRSSVTPVSVEVERIDIGNPEKTGAKPNGKEIVEEALDRPNSDTLLDNNNINEDSDGQQDVFEEIFGACTPENENLAEEKQEFGSDMDVEQPQEQEQQHHHDDDEEIADVDDSGDEAEMGRNAADVLRAQVMTKENKEESSSSSSSGSGSSSSNNSSSSSSESEGSDDDSITSI